VEEARTKPRFCSWPRDRHRQAGGDGPRPGAESGPGRSAGRRRPGSSHQRRQALRAADWIGPGAWSGPDGKHPAITGSLVSSCLSSGFDCALYQAVQGQHGRAAEDRQLDSAWAAKVGASPYLSDSKGLRHLGCPQSANALNRVSATREPLLCIIQLSLFTYQLFRRAGQLGKFISRHEMPSPENPGNDRASVSARFRRTNDPRESKDWHLNIVASCDVIESNGAHAAVPTQ